MGDLIDDLAQKSIDLVRDPVGLNPDPPKPIAPAPKQETVQTSGSAAAALRAKKRKGIAATVLAGAEGEGKSTLG